MNNYQHGGGEEGTEDAPSGICDRRRWPDPPSKRPRIVPQAKDFETGDAANGRLCAQRHGTPTADAWHGDAHRPATAMHGVDDSTPALPPEVWANVLDYSDYRSVLACAAASRSVLRDAMPIVSTLNIEEARQLNATLASKRFRDVREINVYSLLRGRIEEMEESMDFFDLDYDSATSVVPFLSRFANLEQVFLGGRKSSGEIVGFCHEFSLWNDDEDTGRVEALIDAFSGAFRCGALPASLHVRGLRCPNSGRLGIQSANLPVCEVCKRACQNFPLRSVINFESQGSSTVGDCDFSIWRSHYPDVCLSRSQIESIVEARPGGSSLLRSDARFSYLLGRGSRYEIHSDFSSSPFYVVKYSNEELEEIKRVVEFSQFDLKRLTSQFVSDTIMRSFAIGDEGHLPPRDRCYLSEDSVKYLREEVSLPINEEDFLEPAINMNHLPNVIRGVMADDSPIQGDCIFLLCHMLSSDTDPPIFQIIVVIPKLVGFLRRDDLAEQSALRKDAVGGLGKIALKSAICRNLVLEAGAMTPLLHQMDCTNDAFTLKVVSWTLWCLCREIPHSKFALVKSCIVPLCKLLKGNWDLDDVQDVEDNEDMLNNACCAIYCLCRVSDDAIHVVANAQVFLCLMEFASKKNKARRPALNIIKLIFGAGIVPIMRVSDLPQMTPFLYSGDDKIVQSMTCWAICNTIQSCETKKQIRAVTRSGIIPELIQMLKKKDSAIRHDAVRAICQKLCGHRAQIKVLVIKGCIKPLCELLVDNDAEIVDYSLQSLEKILKFGRSGRKEVGLKIMPREIKWIKEKVGLLERTRRANDPVWEMVLIHIHCIKKELACR